MTFQEQKEHEDAYSEHAFRAAIQDMKERFGAEKLAEIIDKELSAFGFEVVNYACS